jgi:hypothetical protein
MSHPKLGLVGLCVLMVGLVGFGDGAAQASPEWLVLNSVGTGLETLPTTIEGAIDGESASLDTHLVKLHIKITCTKGTLVGMSLEVAGKITNGGKVKFEGCSNLTNAATGMQLPECGVKTSGQAFGEVETKNFKGQLLTNGETQIKPESGTEFVKLEFEAGCALSSPMTISGTLFLEDCEGKAAAHFEKHLIKQGSGTSLFMGSDNAEHLETSLVGSLWLFLGGTRKGLKWGAVFP